MADPNGHAWVAGPHGKAEVVAAVEASLETIARVDPQLNAFVATTADLARHDARRLPTGPGDHVTSPLAGMVMAIKDNIDIGGYVTTAGSPTLLDNRVTDDAVVVARLRAAGALIVGKSLLHEFAYGATTKNRHFGACRNPWDRARVPGGSSGGSAVAVAAGMTTAALGTDTGGSVRIPAAFTGISGLRPTHGTVSTRGVFPLGPSIDTVGPMARCFTDVWALFTVLRGHDPRDPWAARPPEEPAAVSPPAAVRGLRIGILDDPFWHAPNTATTRAVADAAALLQDLGATVVLVGLRGADRARSACNTLLLAEALALHEHRLAGCPELIDPDVRARLELGAAVSGIDVVRSIATLRSWRADVVACFESVDLLVTPTTPGPPPEIDPADTITTTHAVTRYTYPWSGAGVPAASIPCGFDPTGLPIGLQLVAGPWQEHRIARAAIAFQAATDFHLRRPPP